MNNKDSMSRRDFLKTALLGASIVVTKDLPEWVEELNKPEVESLAKLCADVLSEDEILDLLDQEDLGTALGLAFTILIEHGEEPEDFLIMKNFLQ